MYKKLSQTADRIEAVLRDRRAPASVVGGKVLPGFVEMLLRPDPGTKVNQVKALQADLALALGNNNVRVAQSGIHLAIQIPTEQRRQVFLSTLIAGIEHIPAHTAVLGLSEDGSPLMARLSAPEVSHVLIAGTTGSGKTSLAQSMLLSLARANRPNQLGCVILDPKKRDGDVFMHAIHRHLMLPVAQTVEDVQSTLQRVLQVMEQRSVDSNPLPRVVVYVDEMADLCQQGGVFVVEALSRIAQRGREAGIHLVGCTQKPSSQAIGSLLRANLPLRLIGRVNSASDARVASGMPATGAEKLYGSGDFLAVHGGKLVRFQAALPQ